MARERDVRLALLFGSWARGDADERSDVDLAVDGLNLDLLALSGRLSARLGREVDVVSLASPSIPLLEQLVADSVVVHEDAHGRAAQWRTAALLQLEIDRPWYRRMRDAWLSRVARQGLDGGR